MASVFVKRMVFPMAASFVLPAPGITGYVCFYMVASKITYVKSVPWSKKLFANLPIMIGLSK
jgi:hypothetical protein